VIEVKRILVAYDSSDPARHALTTAAELAKATGAQVGVVSVVPLHWTRWGEKVAPWDTDNMQARELGEAKAFLEEQGIAAEYVEVHGDRAEAIETLASREGYDTIVIGRQHISMIDKAFETSLYEHVVDHSTATVIVTH
jgi:nucleotide-binding universal stress UspA family protein